MSVVESAESLKYKRILFWILGAFFGIIFIANIFLVYYANDSWTGLTTEDAYQKGVEYNKTIEEHQQSKLLGWEGSIGFMPSSATQGKLSIDLKGKQGKAISGAVVKAKLIRPTSGGNDKTLALMESSNGMYEENITFPLEGVWDIEITATQQENTAIFAKRINTVNLK
jgi:nitrogen fixation protein FixH